MKKLFLVMAVPALLVSIAASAWGTPFVYPPESNPNITWQGQYPYQRNIEMNFGVNPVGPVGPIPGALYEGYDDPALWGSDFVTTTGDVRWDQAKGGIGIFGGGSGTITFHFDNWVRPWPIKHFYEELIFKVELAKGSIYQDFVTPDGMNKYTDSWDKVDNLGVSGYRLSLWAEFQPNPPWEEKVITLSSSTGNIYIDQLHVATECVPEPSSLIALAGGMISLLGIRRRRA